MSKLRILPPSRPQQPRYISQALLDRYSIVLPVALIGSRGYYRRTMGDPDGNDRGIYDDAIILVSPNVYASFNANTDPSVFRKGVATLDEGVWQYKLGIHGLNKPSGRRYEALVQAAQVSVSRDGENGERGFFGINIHRGSATTTSSLGCQTIHPDQWGNFIGLVKAELKRAGQKIVPYILTEGT